MAVYLVLGLFALLLGAWAIGLVLTALVDATRPREAAPPIASTDEDRLQTVRRLTEEWQTVRHHWVREPDEDEFRRAA